MITAKFFIVIGLIWLVSFGFITQVYAREPKETTWVEVEPFWTHTAGINVNLNFFVNGRATMAGSVIGNPGTTHIIGNAVLERMNANGTFTQVASFSNIRAEGNIWVWERNHYVARGHDYRLTITSTVFRNGTSETITSIGRVVRAN